MGLFDLNLRSLLGLVPIDGTQFACIWRYETTRYNALAEFIAKNEVHGDIRIHWNPDLNRAWPQMRRSLGYGFDEAWVLNLAVEYRGGDEISVAASDKSTVIEYDPKASSWVLAKR